MAAATAYERRIFAGLDLTPDADTDGGLTFPAERVYRIEMPDGGRIHVEECGVGPPLVLVHGHGANLAIFAPLAARLAARGRRVVAMDHRGFGRSSPAPRWLDFDGLVDDLAFVLEALDMRGATVVGHSMGGAVVLGLAARRPEVTASRVTALVQINGTSHGPPDCPLWRARVAVLDSSVSERLGRHPRHGVALTRSNFGPDARLSHVVGVRQVGFASSAAHRRGFTRRLLGVDLGDELDSIDMPVLVLVGAADRVVPLAESERLVDAIRDARIHVFDGAGHVLPVERADHVAEQIVRFAEDVDGSRRRDRAGQR